MRPFGDVSDALIATRKTMRSGFAQEQTVADWQESVRLSIIRYRGGTTTYLEVPETGSGSLPRNSCCPGTRDKVSCLVQLYGAWRRLGSIESWAGQSAIKWTPHLQRGRLQGIDCLFFFTPSSIQLGFPAARPCRFVGRNSFRAGPIVQHPAKFGEDICLLLPTIRIELFRLYS